MRCYQHARYLKHPNPDELIKRIDAIIYHWNHIPYGFDDGGRGLAKQRDLHEKIFLAELKETEEWLNDFHAAEATLVENGETPTFDQTAAQNQTKRFRPTENIASKMFSP